MNVNYGHAAPDPASASSPVPLSQAGGQRIGSHPLATMSNPHLPPPQPPQLDLAEYRHRLEQHWQWAGERQHLEHDLVARLEQLQRDYAEKSLDFANEQNARRRLQEEAAEYRHALAECQRVIDASPFACVILDGDGALFHDALYARGRDGGHEAARLLADAVHAHLREVYGGDRPAATAGWSIVVHVVLNLDGLARKLHACRVVQTVGELAAFGAAFGIAQPLFNFVNVGEGKEMADHKVRELLRLMVRTIQCRHVLVGPCHDNGYLPVLAQYVGDREVAPRLTLLETVPALPGFASLPFRRTSFPSVFRAEHLPVNNRIGGVLPTNTATTSTATTTTTTTTTTKLANEDAPPLPPPMFANAKASTPKPNAAKPPKDTPVTANTATTTTKGTWATIGKQYSSSNSSSGGGGANTIDISSPSPSSAAQRFIVVNKYDERIDLPLARFDQQADRRLTAKVEAEGGVRFCNKYHLTGRCEADAHCQYQHGARVTGQEQLVLKHKARSLRCAALLECRSVDCYVGHHCRNGSACKLERCAFPETHLVDMKPVKKIFEDGTEKPL